MSIPKDFGTVVFLFKTVLAATESAKVDDGVLLYVEETWCIRCFISSLLRSFHAGCSESTGDEEGWWRRTFCTSRKPDEVYGAYQQLAMFIPRRLLRKCRRRRRSTMVYILASRKLDEVYGALSAACYVHSTQAAQKVPETKKVDDGVYSVR